MTSFSNNSTPLLKISIVIFNNDFFTIYKNIESINRQQVPCIIFLIDHSPENNLQIQILETYKESNVRYYFRGNFNSGYGGGNNFSFSQEPHTPYFLVLNPDVEMNPSVLKFLLDDLNSNQNCGLIFPKVINIDGSIQYNVKRHPNVLALAGRRFPLLSKISMIQKSMDFYEYIDFDYSKSSEVEFVGGCFMLLRSSVFGGVKGFDEGYFLYFEDYDLCSKIRKLGYEIKYNSQVSIVHAWSRGSHKSLLLFKTFLMSMFRFFGKWGVKWY